ncbi:MAG: MarR family transcriptional regulator, partial [Acidobacteriota bacterium]
MNLIYSDLLRDTGLTYPQYLVLVLLWQRDDRPVGDLARELYLKYNTLTPLVKRLEAAGFVTRRRSETDEREVRVSLTAEGHALQESLLQ